MAKSEDLIENQSAIPNASSRRGFLKGVGVAGLAASLTPLSTAETAFGGETTSAVDKASVLIDDRAAVEGVKSATSVPVTLKVNGVDHNVNIDPRASLLDTLRESLHLTGTKKGCDHGQCGACTVHINGKRANSCLSLALCNQGDEITTIEGLGTPDNLHPMQAAFVEHDGFQCGYCTSGQIMSATAMIKEPWGPEDADIKEAMSGNICRCGAYSNILDAIKQVRKETK